MPKLIIGNDYSNSTALMDKGVYYREKKLFNIPMNGCIGSVNSSGDLSTPTESTIPDFSSIKYFNEEKAFAQKFRAYTNFTGDINFGLKELSHTSALYYTFADTDILSINFPELTEIKSSGNYSLERAFYNCPLLHTANFDNLEIIAGSYALDGCFRNCSNLYKVSFKKLNTLRANRCFTNAFQYNTSLHVLKFESLNNIKSNTAQVFYNTFSYCNTLDIYFYALNTDSFGVGSSQFKFMFYNTQNATAHFPLRVKSTIENWADIIGRCGGNVTCTVLFDIITTLNDNYLRHEIESTSTAIAWKYNNTLYYTQGNNEPVVGDNIYSDPECTQLVEQITTLS